MFHVEQLVTDAVFHVEQNDGGRQGWIKGRPKGPGKNKRGLPPRGWEGSWKGSGAKRSCLSTGLPDPSG